VTAPALITARFDPAALQTWTPARTFFVDPDACRRYAAATNEDDPDEWAAGVAPPVFSVVATVPHVHEVLQANVPERARAENRSVHGEHDVRYHRPLVPGSTLLVRGRLYGVVPKSSGTLLVTLVEMTDPGTGCTVNEQYFVNFLRGVTTDEPTGQEPSPHRLPEAASLGDPVETARYTIDADQTYRYAEASGDHSIYHLDDTAARAAGFNGIIVHGLCTMAFASRAVVAGACGGDPSRLRRLAVRFSRPMYPGHTMTTTLWAQAPAGDSSANFRFQVADDSGATVITDGLAAVAPTGEE
jgi:acyl dehydratase